MWKFFTTGIAAALAAAGLHEFVGGPLAQIPLFFLMGGSFVGGMVVYLFAGLAKADGNKRINWAPYAHVAALVNTLSLLCILSVGYCLYYLALPAMPFWAAMGMMLALAFFAFSAKSINNTIAVKWGLISR